MNMYSLAPEKITPFMQQVTMTCLKVLVDEKCDEIPEPFKFEVGKFIKNVVMATQLPLLQQFEAQMSPEEKASLAKFLA